jgi:acetyl esterase/lipase
MLRPLLFVLSLFAYTLPTESQVIDRGPEFVYQPSATVKRVNDIAYANRETGDLKLDLYLPRGNWQEPHPGVIIVRGGGWTMGDKEGYAHLANSLAEAGVAAASIEYRTSSDHPYPAAVHDARDAIRWLRSEGGNYGINTEHVGVLGASAGGQIAILLGTTNDIIGNHDQADAVVALAPVSDLVDWYQWSERKGDSAARRNGTAYLGATIADAPDLWRTASPVNHVDAESAPILLVHSLSDRGVPHTQSLALLKRYKDSGVRAECHLFSRPSHAFWGYTRWHTKTMKMAAAFFRETLMTSARE